MGDLTRLLSFNGTENQKTRLKTIPTAPHHSFPHHFLIRHNTSIHPFTISYSLFSAIRPVFLLLLPLAYHVSLSLVSWCTRDVNNGRLIPPPTQTMPPSLHLDHLLSSTDHTDFSARRQLSDVSTAIAKARRIVTISGAGISCSSGIPVGISLGEAAVANDNVRRTGFPLGRRTVLTRKKQIPRYVLHRQRPVFGGDVCEPAIDFSILHIHR